MSIYFYATATPVMYDVPFVQRGDVIGPQRIIQSGLVSPERIRERVRLLRWLLAERDIGKRYLDTLRDGRVAEMTAIEEEWVQKGRPTPDVHFLLGMEEFLYSLARDGVVQHESVSTVVRGISFEGVPTLCDDLRGETGEIMVAVLADATKRHDVERSDVEIEWVVRVDIVEEVKEIPAWHVPERFSSCCAVFDAYFEHGWDGDLTAKAFEEGVLSLYKLNDLSGVINILYIDRYPLDLGRILERDPEVAAEAVAQLKRKGWVEEKEFVLRSPRPQMVFFASNPGLLTMAIQTTQRGSARTKLATAASASFFELCPRSRARELDEWIIDKLEQLGLIHDICESLRRGLDDIHDEWFSHDTLLDYLHIRVKSASDAAFKPDSSLASTFASLECGAVHDTPESFIVSFTSSFYKTLTPLRALPILPVKPGHNAVVVKDGKEIVTFGVTSCHNDILFTAEAGRRPMPAVHPTCTEIMDLMGLDVDKRFLFLGTTYAAAGSICMDGVQLIRRQDGWLSFGVGLYLTENTGLACTHAGKQSRTRPSEGGPAVVVFEITDTVTSRIDPAAHHVLSFPIPSERWSAAMVELNRDIARNWGWIADDYPEDEELRNEVNAAHVVLAPIIKSRDVREALRLEDESFVREVVFRGETSNGENHIDPPILNTALCGVFGFPSTPLYG